MDHAEKARALFLEGYNCAQAVMCAFDDLTGLDRETSARLACSFGGGMGYHLVQEFARRFKEINGTIICRELLSGVKTKPGNEPEARTPEYYASRPCLRHVGEAAAIVDELLREQMQDNSDQ